MTDTVATFETFDADCVLCGERRPCCVECGICVQHTPEDSACETCTEQHHDKATEAVRCPATNTAGFICLDFATGKLAWRNRAVGKGALTYADGHLYILSEDAVVGLAEATSAGYQEKGRFEIKDQGWPSWAHPVVSRGRLYIRNQGVLASYDIRAH